MNPNSTELLVANLMDEMTATKDRVARLEYDANREAQAIKDMRGVLSTHRELIEISKRVVAARHDSSDRGWDLLKNAIAELEAFVGSPK